MSGKIDHRLALIVQGIEQRFPKPPIQVRVQVRAQKAGHAPRLVVTGDLKLSLHSLMDKTKVSGTFNVGSSPTGDTKNTRHKIWYLIDCQFYFIDYLISYSA